MNIRREFKLESIGFVHLEIFIRKFVPEYGNEPPVFFYRNDSGSARQELFRERPLARAYLKHELSLLDFGRVRNGAKMRYPAQEMLAERLLFY